MTNKLFLQTLVSIYLENKSNDMSPQIVDLVKFIDNSNYFNDDDIVNESGRLQLSKMIDVLKKDSDNLDELTKTIYRILKNHLSNKVREYRQLKGSEKPIDQDKYFSTADKKEITSEKSRRRNNWFTKKTGADMNELLGARLFGIFVPGSPKVKSYGVSGTASKEVKSGRFLEDISDITGALNRKGLAESLLLSVLLGDSDFHNQNILLNNIGRFVRIDFEALFTNRHPQTKKPSNPEKFTFNELNFSEALAKIPMDDTQLQHLKESVNFRLDIYKAFLKIYLYPRDVLMELINFSNDPARDYLKEDLSTGMAKMFDLLDQYYQNIFDTPEFIDYLNSTSKDELMKQIMNDYALGEDGHGFARIRNKIEDISEKLDSLYANINKRYMP